jgi:hypothetical protein
LASDSSREALQSSPLQMKKDAAHNFPSVPYPFLHINCQIKDSFQGIHEVLILDQSIDLKKFVNQMGFSMVRKLQSEIAIINKGFLLEL